MSNAAEQAPRPVNQLSVGDRERLARAYTRLREAADAYNALLSGPLEPGREGVVHDASKIAAAQAEIQVAEDDLWKLRESLLDWARPASAARAVLVADWFSDEDRVYDEPLEST